MERPTIISSGPDAMGRTVCFGNESSRRARYGRIQPMPTKKPLAKLISGLFRLR